MAKGKFVISRRVEGYENFIAFDSDEAGAECSEATNPENLGLRMSAETAARFHALESGASLVFGDWEYFVEWRESPLAREIRENPRFELVHVT